MKLATDIPLRKDNTITAVVPESGGMRAASYTFKPDANGEITADVADKDHVGYLLDTGNFYPADENDIDAGVAVVTEPEGDKETPAPAAKKASTKK